MTGPAGGPPSSDSPIEAYLDQLLAASVPGPRRQTRHLLNEAEAHLLDAAAELEAAGMRRQDAEQEAVDRFGPPQAIAAAERQLQTTPLLELVRQCVLSALLLGSIGGMAVGASGMIAAAMERVGGQSFLVNAPTGSVLSASNCTRWLAGSDRVMTCAQAGLADWAHDTVLFRMAAGAAGVLALVAFFAVRRWRAGPGRRRGLPGMVVGTATVVAFGTAGLWLAGLGIDRVVVASGHGAGQWLSAAPVALGLAVVFGLRLSADLRRPFDTSPATAGADVP